MPQTVADSTPLYETPKLLSEYLLFHYGTEEEIITHPSLPREALNFAVRTVTELLPAVLGSQQRALDVGCAVGRSSFELSKHFEEVVGIDYSHSFVDAAERLRLGETLVYQRRDEAAAFTNLAAMAPSANPARISFQQGDAMHLPEALGKFDLVHAANLICRLTEPKLFLARLPSLVNAGGLLLLTTPCTWLEEFTPAESWPKGPTIEWLKENLAGSFELEETKDLPFLIREHARKYQHTIAQGSRWRRL